MQIFFILFDVPFDLAPGQEIFGCACSDPSLREQLIFCHKLFSFVQNRDLYLRQNKS